MGPMTGKWRGGQWPSGIGIEFGSYGWFLLMELIELMNGGDDDADGMGEQV